MRRRLALLLCTVLVVVLVAGCGSKNEAGDSSAEAKKTLRIGTEPVSHILADSGVEVLEEMGYEVEIVMFDDFFTPNQALVEGQIDANFYEHQPFLDMYNAENNTDIQMVDTFYQFFSGIYSEKYTTLDEIKEAGGTIRIAEDASNQSLNLQDLEDAGLITLVDEEKDLYNLADIAENPYNFEFIAMDGTEVWESRGEFTAYLNASNGMADLGLDPMENLVYKIDRSSEALGICVMPENMDAPWVQDLITAYKSDKSKEYVATEFGGAMVPVE